jgi:hypothetical protein
LTPVPPGLTAVPPTPPAAPTMPYFLGHRLLAPDGTPITAPGGLHPLQSLGVGGRFVDHRGITMEITRIRNEVDAKGHGFQVIVARSV